MYDFAILGSGVAGGRLAQELTAQGARCVLVEAGQALDAKTFPRRELDGGARLFWGGGAELTADGRIGLLRARCLGGTSIVNQALVDRFDDDALDDWRQRTGIAWLDQPGMRPHYERAEAGIRIAEIAPEHRNRNALLFAAGLREQDLVCKPLQRAQGDCALERGSDCIVCLNGCPRDSKQSALVTTIARARQQGLTIEAELEVERIEPGQGQVRVLGLRRGAREELVARRVVLAAGALGSTGILLRSGFGQRLPALGTRFSCHPQVMTYARFADPVDAHKGAFQALKSQDPGLRRAGFKLENVFAPPVATAMLLPQRGRAQHRLMRQYRHLASIEVAVRDDPAGRITLDRRGRLVVHKPLTGGDRARIRQGLDLVQRIFVALGAEEIVPCRQAFGLHLMGGCALGTDPRTSVVGPDFRVHGCADIAVCDSSVFPSAPGINPSLTIMALAAKAGQELAA